MAPASWPDNAYTGCYMPIRPGGASRYWQDCTFGLLNLGDSAVFPWRVLDIDTPTAGALARATVITRAIEMGLDDGFPLHQFPCVVVVVIPNTPGVLPDGTTFNAIDGGAQSVATRGGNWSAALMSEDGDQDFFAHEFGHVLFFDHSWGRRWGFPQEYGDPYCIMSAQDYGPGDPIWVSPADPAMPVHAAYWGHMGPRPAAATLYQHLPEFLTSGYAVDLGSNFVNYPRTVRIHALDTGRKPCLAVVNLPGSARKYTVEYRRQVGWDAGVTPAVVIHSVGPGFIATQPIRTVYEGRIPVPQKGDIDWRSDNKQIGVLLDSVEPDGSAVDVTIGSGTMLEPQIASIEFLSYGGQELAEEGYAEVNIPPTCGMQRFRFFIDHSDAKIQCSASAQGFVSPKFSWKVNGVAVPVHGAELMLAPAVSTNVLATFPRPDSETTAWREARLEYAIDGNTLTLTGRREDGNYAIAVEVTATEGDEDADVGQSAVSTASTKVEGIFVSFEQAYYDAVATCWAMFSCISDKYAKSKPKWFRKDERLSRNIAVMHRWREIVQADDAALAAQVSAGIAALQNLQALQLRQLRRADDKG